MFKLSIVHFLVIFTFSNFNQIKGHENAFEDGDYEHGLNQNVTLSRSKRGVVNLYLMMKCGNNKCKPFSYNGHGCFCGKGGSGIPVDDIDKCCRMHDICYSKINVCISWFYYCMPYEWECSEKGKPICDYEKEKDNGKLSIGQELCKCDRDFALCLSQFSCPEEKAKCIPGHGEKQINETQEFMTKEKKKLCDQNVCPRINSKKMFVV
ncbi:basic phospholipase A2 nigroxin A-like [Leptopilina boulardi]|uniref:basic phospholipase A2 nigroxin A-like n=1 Tax=Leptopilina boulardi TaxID=63433 RepID=UPI0021F5CEBF|nr:basic phospholipase A2 nigroxin A-like [Leptopilina boulardi]